MECIRSRAEGENRPFWKVTVSGMGDQSMHGSRFRMFHVSMTAPPFGATLESLTVPLLFTWIIENGPVYLSEPCLRLESCFIMTLSPTSYSCGMRLAFSLLLFWRISFCLRSLIYCQSAWKEMFSRASRPNTNCVGVARLVVCTVDVTACLTALRIPFQWKSGSRSD